MKDTHDIDIKNVKENIFYIIPISNSCDNCIKLNLELLASLHGQNLIPILIGSNIENSNQSNIQIIKDKYSNVYFDNKEEIYSFQTGFSKPLLIHIIEGKCVYFLEVSDFKINIAKEYLQ